MFNFDEWVAAFIAPPSGFELVSFKNSLIFTPVDGGGQIEVYVSPTLRQLLAESDEVTRLQLGEEAAKVIEEDMIFKHPKLGPEDTYEYDLRSQMPSQK